MHKKSGTKKIGDVSVAKLLDDFVDLSTKDANKRAGDIDDDEYIRMMLEKEDKRKQERSKRESLSTTHDDSDIQSIPSENIEESQLQHIEQEEMTFEAICESDLSPEDEMVVEEIMKSQGTMGEPILSRRMRTSVGLLQNEASTREIKRKARKTLEKYRKDSPNSTEKKVTPIISEKRAPIKSCQICYFCVGERKVSGSCWCHCTNPGRSTHAIVKGSWVKSRLNLPCWKPPQD
jgi:hypothetical protein